MQVEIKVHLTLTQIHVHLFLEAKVLFTTKPIAPSTTELHSPSMVEPVSPTTCLPTNPCLEQPNTICVLSKGKETCICMEGYTKDDKGEECEGMLHCALLISTFIS